MANDNALVSFAKNLEVKLQQRADDLEDIHMEAAIDAELTKTDGPNSNARPVIVLEAPLVTEGAAKKKETEKDVLFNDYNNPNAVANCLSPFVPTSSERLGAFLSLLQLRPYNAELGEGDVLLDIGCGDGRVCVSAAKVSGCRAIGFDVSPPCIAMAKQVALDEGLSEDQCSFYEVDATMDPNILLKEDSPLSSLLASVTVIFLYTYPTLLMKLIPLLERLTTPAEDDEKGDTNNVRAVATLTYHLPDENATLQESFPEHEIRVYSRVAVTHSDT